MAAGIDPAHSSHSPATPTSTRSWTMRMTPNQTAPISELEM